MRYLTLAFVLFAACNYSQDDAINTVVPQPSSPGAQPHENYRTHSPDPVVPGDSSTTPDLAPPADLQPGGGDLQPGGDLPSGDDDPECTCDQPAHGLGLGHCHDGVTHPAQGHGNGHCKYDC